MSTLVKKIIFRNNYGLDRLYFGNELIFFTEKEPVELEYLTFTAIEPSTIQYVPSTVATAEYSYDKVHWNSADNVTLNLNTDYKVFFKGNITGNQSYSNYSKFTMTGKIGASGSIMSMQNYNPDDKTIKYNYEFYHLFYNCSSLITSPELPATTLSENCYRYMFDSCTSLVTAPKLPATTLTHSCYDVMFSGCTSLVNAPALPATTLAKYCYYGIFSSCTSLVNAPALPATTLAFGCYDLMFDGCTSLVTAPDLPANTLAQSCYQRMFDSCTSLVTAPKLPATTLAHQCYNGMFKNCTSLVNAPELPATTLEQFCYDGMFINCTSLVKAPELPATTLSDYCYNNMFSNCSKLNYIKCYANEYNSNWFTDWVKDVAHTGDFYCYDSKIFPIGSSGIPNGWTTHNIEYDELYVTGRYNFKIPKGDGTYYVIDTKNDCEVDIISDNNKSSLTGKIFTSNSVGDQYEWDLFFTNTRLYFDLSFKNNRRLSWTFGTLNANTKYTIGGSNGNYLGTDRALYVNGSKKASSTTKSTYNNTSDISYIGENVTDFYIGNIKIYEKTGLVYHIVPIMYNGNVAFYDKVNKRFMEITATPPSDYVRTRATGEKVII